MDEKQKETTIITNEIEKEENQNLPFAVIETGGKQYVVKDGDVLDFEKLEGDADSAIVFDKVLLTYDGETTIIGTPYVENAKVSATIVDQHKDKKKIVFKFKNKTGYKRFKGHRQALTRVKFL